MTKEERTLLLSLCAVMVSEAMARRDTEALKRMEFLREYLQPFLADVEELRKRSMSQ